MYPKYKDSHKVLTATHHQTYMTLWAWSKLSTLVCNQEVVSAEYKSRLALWSTRLWHLECNSIILNVSIIYFYYIYIFFGHFDNNNYNVFVFIAGGGGLNYVFYFFWMLKCSQEFYYCTLPCIEAGLLFPWWDFWTSSRCSAWLS